MAGFGWQRKAGIRGEASRSIEAGKSWVGLNTRVTGAGRGIGEDSACVLGKEGPNCSVHALHSKDGTLETVEAILL